VSELQPPFRPSDTAFTGGEAETGERLILGQLRPWYSE